MQYAQSHLIPVRHLWSPPKFWTQSNPSSPLHSLPADVLLDIASHLPSVSDTLHLALASSELYAKVTPAVYKAVDLQGVDQCELTLSMLQQYPHVARHVQKLVVRPEKSSLKEREYTRAWDNAGHVSRLVAATTQYLDALRAFEWDGEDMLPDDRMWSELRMRCPNLRYVGTSFGCFLPRPTSHLFKFSGLTGFSIVFKDGFYAHELHIHSRGPYRPLSYTIPANPSQTESEPVFTSLWDMLINRCPELESFSITGTSTVPFDAGRVCTARWPRLRTLTIGNVVFTPSAAMQMTMEDPFLTFLADHPRLRSLHILGSHEPPTDVTGLNPGALPCLTEFSGSLDQLRALVDRGQPPLAIAAPIQNQSLALSPTSLATTLQHVSFPAPMQLRELTLFTISRVFSSLHALTSLQITFALQSGHDSNGVLRTIVGACPHLLHLDLTCSSKPSFSLESLSRSLRNLLRLRTLSLTVVKASGEEPMHVGAARIALANPRLQTFFIIYISPHVPADAASAPPVLERGEFKLRCDAHGIPVNLLVSEWRASLWTSGGSVVQRGVRGLGSVVGVSGDRLSGGKRGGWGKQWVYELRASGHPDVAQKSWSELIVEQSPAGEETRLLGFCVFLVLMALWGVLARAVGARYA